VLPGAILGDHVEAAGAVAVDLVCQLSGLPHGERGAQHRLLGGLLFGQVDAAERELGAAAIRPPKAGDGQGGHGGGSGSWVTVG
jgi:hypothetical protein